METAKCSVYWAIPCKARLVMLSVLLGQLASGATTGLQWAMSAEIRFETTNCYAVESSPYISASCLIDIAKKDFQRMRRRGLHVCSVTCSDSEPTRGAVLCVRGQFIETTDCGDIPKHEIQKSKFIRMQSDPMKALKAEPLADTQRPLLVCPSLLRKTVPRTLGSDPALQTLVDPVATDNVDGVIVPQKVSSPMFPQEPGVSSTLVAYTACDRVGNCATCSVIVTVSGIKTGDSEITLKSVLIVAVVTMAIAGVILLATRVLRSNHGKRTKVCDQ